ncbi:MAG: RNA-binding protein [Elusimicrobia bacterium]|nr:RNA-binding protein [Elusimicrobiota bacterium]
MGKKMFVGGLPYEVTESQLKTIFAACGTVVSAKVIMDRETGRSKGFGFVEMSTDAEAADAIAKLNNSPVGERRMFVNEARPMEPRAPGSPRPGGFSGPKPGGFGDKPAFGGFGDRPNFGPDKKGFHERKKKYEDRKGGFDGGGKGGKPGKGGFGEKKGGKKGRGDFDDDGGW